MDWMSLFIPADAACDGEKLCSGFIRSQCFYSEICWCFWQHWTVQRHTGKVISSTLTTLTLCLLSLYFQPHGKNPLFPKCLHLFFSLVVKTRVQGYSYFNAVLYPFTSKIHKRCNTSVVSLLKLFNLPLCWVLDSCLSFWVIIYKCLNLVSLNLSAWANWYTNMFYSWETSSANLEASAGVINNACSSSSTAWDAPNTPPVVF